MMQPKFGGGEDPARFLATGSDRQISLALSQGSVNAGDRTGDFGDIRLPLVGAG
jgi:hypothetical protein